MGQAIDAVTGTRRLGFGISFLRVFWLYAAAGIALCLLLRNGSYTSQLTHKRCRPIETLRKVLAPLVTFTLDGPATHQTVKYSVGIPKNPIKVSRADIDFAIEKVRTGEITQRQLQQWASMLLLNDAFDWSGEDEDAIADMLADLTS